MFKARLSLSTMWIPLLVISLIVLAQYFSVKTKYANIWSKKITQSIADTEMSGGSVSFLEDTEGK